jgi:hypothetical protein
VTAQRKQQNQGKGLFDMTKTTKTTKTQSKQYLATAELGKRIFGFINKQRDIDYDDEHMKVFLAASMLVTSNLLLNIDCPHCRQLAKTEVTKFLNNVLAKIPDVFDDDEHHDEHWLH